MVINDNDIHEVIICNQDTSLLDVSLMLRQSLSRICIVVNEDDKMLGIISLQDIVYRGVCEEKNLENTFVKEIMSTQIDFIDKNESFEELCKKINILTSHQIPVIQDNKIIGIIDRFVLLKSLYAHCNTNK